MKKWVVTYRKWLIGLSCLLLFTVLGYLGLYYNIIFVESYVKRNAILVSSDEEADGQFLYKIHNAYFFMNEKQELIQKPFASVVYPFNENGIALYKEHLSQKWGFVNREGKIVKKAFMTDLAFWTPSEDEYFITEDSFRYKTNICKCLSLFLFKVSMRLFQLKPKKTVQSGGF